ncbi:dinucleotide-utilizing enzyme [Microbacterium barkeri]|uniref:dinucleotide-utilizing enzyme n=1 Tax=Microbacterium barkeri TaxID=33917 RepID=UPI0024AEBE0B|nr:dinucleotide-utilizing enzyme [Microbacterium barkeri]MDI6944344.1 dinucleotide-utilizing enzyme [Microbacterium barkeri]
MTHPARLTRSAAYWTLVLASVLAIAGGLALSLPRIGTMEEMLLNGTATGVEVYVGQAWITLAAGLVGAGAVGLILALALAAAKALVAPRAAEAQAPAASAEDEPIDDEPADDEPAAHVHTAPAVSEPAEIR